MKAPLESSLHDSLEPPTDMNSHKDDNVQDLCQVVIRNRRRREILDPSPSLLRFRAFQHQCHSLRINVSELAACAGFHPYKCLPKLLYEHVYQGMAGQALLMHDAKLLGLRVVSDQQVWQELAQKASVATQKALDQALKVQTGLNKLASIQAAETLRRHIVKEAKSSKRLTSQQLAMLEDGARHCIHTGFGTTWESDALDLYEKQCGWEITERNAQVRIWNFDSHGNQLGPPQPSSSSSSNSSDETSKTTIDGLVDEEDPSDSDQLSSTNFCNLSKRQKFASNIHDKDTLPEVTDRSDNNNDSTRMINEVAHPNAEEASFVQVDSLPYFSLRGSVDGIRQELVPIPKQQRHTTKDNNDNNSNTYYGDGDDEFDTDVTWSLRQIIVECKHRMHRLQAIPPIYEMIQATVYCLMYDTQDADLIEVLRTEEGSTRQRHQGPKKSIQEKENKVMNKITNFLVTEKASTNEDAIKTTESEVEASLPSHDENSGNKKLSPSPIESHAKTMDDTELHKLTINSSNKSEGDGLQIGTTAAPSTPNQLEISVYRISIDDELFQHRQNWQNIVLPRLRAWTDAVYSVRKDDDKRYRLLLALAEERLQLAWNILLDECPWLRDCDTSYTRDVAN